MKLKFKIQPYQTSAVESVIDCFAGQMNTSGVAYRIDPGVNKKLLAQQPVEETCFSRPVCKEGDCAPACQLCHLEMIIMT